MFFSKQISTNLCFKEKKAPFTSDSEYVVGRAPNGMPLFPEMDFSKVEPNMVQKVIEGFFQYLWGMISS
jgi:hypothetical protein